MTPGAPDKRRHRLRAIMHGALFAALAAGVFGLLPQFGGVARDAAELRQASPWLIAAAVAAQAAGALGPHRAGAWPQSPVRRRRPAPGPGLLGLMFAALGLYLQVKGRRRRPCGAPHCPWGGKGWRPVRHLLGTTISP